MTFDAVALAKNVEVESSGGKEDHRSQRAAEQQQQFSQALAPAE